MGQNNWWQMGVRGAEMKTCFQEPCCLASKTGSGEENRNDIFKAEKLGHMKTEKFPHRPCNIKDNIKQGLGSLGFNR